ncbi:MAG: DNA polymerase IV [Anaerolineaceae bacterium]|nr:DNA polymerase IV [Anaerolineaceae bacterium]
MARKILHVDLDAFFCSVEEKLDPALKGKPFATGGSPEGRGVVSSCSYAARQYGIHSAMPMRQAFRKYPQLLVVRGHYKEYSNQSKEVMKIIHALTPLVEQISIDEAFLDVSDLPAEPKRIASDLQMAIYSNMNLPCSIGAASNKLVAKIATNIGKSKHKGNTPPMAINVIDPGKEQEFLDPLPVIEMWGIGPKTAEDFNSMGIRTIGDIVKFPQEILVKKFGNYAYDLIKRAMGIDDHPVSDLEGIKSVSNETTFFRDVNDKRELLMKIKQLSEKVAMRLRRKHLSGKTVKIKIRWPDFETHTRQLTLLQPTNQDSIIQQAACELFIQEWTGGKSVRLIGVGVTNLTNEVQQLSLFNDLYQRESKLLNAIDELQERFGEKSIRKGIDLNDF